jgi:hypothetical protein
MGCMALAKQSISLGLSIVLVFTVGPGVGNFLAYQSTEPSPGEARLQLLVIPGRAWTLRIPGSRRRGVDRT